MVSEAFYFFIITDRFFFFLSVFCLRRDDERERDRDRDREPRSSHDFFLSFFFSIREKASARETERARGQCPAVATTSFSFRVFFSTAF